MDDDSVNRFQFVDIIGATVCLAVLAVGGYFVVVFGINESRALSAEQKALAAELDTLTQTAATVEEAETLVATLRDEVNASASEPLPERPDFGAFYSLVLELAREAEVDIARVQPADVMPAGTYSVLPIRIEMEASFEGVYDFVEGVLNDVSYCRIADMHLSGSAEPGDCNVMMGVELFGQALEPAS